MNIIHKKLVSQVKALLKTEGFTVIPQERVRTLLNTGAFAYFNQRNDLSAKLNIEDVHLFLADQYAEILVNINIHPDGSEFEWIIEWKQYKVFDADAGYESTPVCRSEVINRFVIPELKELLSSMKSAKQVMSEFV